MHYYHNSNNSAFQYWNLPVMIFALFKLKIIMKYQQLAKIKIIIKKIWWPKNGRDLKL